MEPAATSTSISLVSILTIILGSGLFSSLVSFVLTAIRETWRDSKKAKAELAYTAAKLAVHLERFAFRCASKGSENDDYVDSKGAIGAPKVDIPRWVEYPAELDWRSMPASLAAQVLSFENERAVAQDSVRSARHSFGTDYEHTRDHCALVGWRAWTIAEKLRKAGKLPELSVEHLNWDYTDWLRKRAQIVRDIRAKNAALSASQ